MSSSLSYFDMLCLGETMTDLVEGFSRPELHLFGYAACLLSLYEGRPVADWGYDFVSSENGLPFSQDLDAAINVASSLDYVHGHGPLMLLTLGGRSELEQLSQLEVYKERRRFLIGAAEALLVFNPGSIREAFNYDPAIRYLREGKRTDWVLTGPVVDRFYNNFEQLRQALEANTSDLSVPLVSWLKYLLQMGRVVQQ